MKQSNTSRYAYLAGIVDGEGCIRVNRNDSGNRKVPSYAIRIQVAQKNGKMIDWLYGNFGGTITSSVGKGLRIRQNREIYESHGFTYRWSLNTVEDCLPVLKRILPFSTEKHPQIEVAIEFCHFLNKHRKTIPWKKHGKRSPHKDEESTQRYIDKCEYYLRKIQELKKQIILCAAVETKPIESSQEDK